MLYSVRTLCARLTIAMTIACLALTTKPATAQDAADASLEAILNNTNGAPFAQPGRVPFDLARRPDVLDLEFSLQRADLVMAARLVEVTESKVVQGGRNVQVTQQYKFEPVRVLKGIFARDALLLTGADLGVYQFAAAGDRLMPGQTLLILLARQGQNYVGCNPSPSLGQSIPRLADANDPLLAAVDVLIAAGRQRDRRERARTLLDGLKKAKGRDATPLLLALERRAAIAARDPGVGDAVLPFLKSDSASIREVAAVTVRAVLESVPRFAAPKGALPGDAAATPLQIAAARALEAALNASSVDIAARVAMIEAWGAAGGARVGLTPAQEQQLRTKVEPPTASNAEAAARYRMLAKAPVLWKKEEIIKVYQGMLLDASAELQAAVGEALVALDAASAAELISQRLARKGDAGLGVSSEIHLLSTLPSALAAPALLKAWERSLNVTERFMFAQACLKVADARLVPALGSLLDPRQWNIRVLAVSALERINTDEAASVLRLHLDEEYDAAGKLRLTAFLARHNIHDGDAAALESLSDANLREEAVNAVVAVGGPKVVAELQRIWRTSNDPISNASAVRALARLGQKEIAPGLLEIAKTAGDPLAPSALLALADLGTPEALAIVGVALNSRRDPVVLNAARAAVTLLKTPGLRDEAVRDRLASLLTDVDASLEVRDAALSALIKLDDPRLPAALTAAARDVNLEGTPLLARIEAALEARPDNP